MFKKWQNFMIITVLLLTIMITSLKNKKTKLHKSHKSHKSNKALATPQASPKNSTASNVTSPTNKEKTDNKKQTASEPKKLQGTKSKREVAVVPTNDISKANNEIDYLSARDIICTESNCQGSNICLSDKKTCKCGAAYAEFNLNKPLKEGEKRLNKNMYCEYERKAQLTYFLLELILNIGAGHLYAGNIGMGV